MAMKLWQLTPYGFGEPRWRASRYRGEVIVRAETAQQARRLASSQFFIAATATGSQEDVADPWGIGSLRHSLVHAGLIDDPRYSLDGPAAIVGPPELIAAHGPFTQDG